MILLSCIFCSGVVRLTTLRLVITVHLKLLGDGRGLLVTQENGEIHRITDGIQPGVEGICPGVCFSGLSNAGTG